MPAMRKNNEGQVLLVTYGSMSLLAQPKALQVRTHMCNLQVEPACSLHTRLLKPTTPGGAPADTYPLLHATDNVLIVTYLVLYAPQTL